MITMMNDVLTEKELAIGHVVATGKMLAMKLKVVAKMEVAIMTKTTC